MFSRSIGVLSRVVTFTLSEEWEDVETPSNEITSRAKVSGELTLFTEFIRSEFPHLSEFDADQAPYTLLDPYD